MPTPQTPEQPPRRICRTPEESFRAGFEDGKKYDRPLSPAEIHRLAKLLRPYFAPQDQQSA